MSALRQNFPIIVLIVIALGALKIGPKVRTEPMPPAWVPVIREEAPPKAPKPPKVPVDGASLTGSIDIEDAYDLGDPIYITLSVENTGVVSLTEVMIWLPLPVGTNTVQGARFLRFPIKRLKPGQSVTKQGTLVQQIAGKVALQARFISNESPDASIKEIVRISTAVLTILPNFEDALINEGASELCFTVTNHGGAPARDLVVRLHDLTEEYLIWKELEPGASTEACFDLSSLVAGKYELTAEASAFAADIAYYENELVVEVRE
jgi:hypothetical protein|tara:strand:- start:1463 stop:2254 length:792 start_codon:yes stop_codon:yes gene_type:complete